MASLFLQYATCIGLLSSGRIDAKPLITHRFGFNAKDVLEGFETASKPDQTGAIKVMFNI
jgi:L-iditol 2-dehydrogenase